MFELVSSFSASFIFASRQASTPMAARINPTSPVASRPAAPRPTSATHTPPKRRPPRCDALRVVGFLLLLTTLYGIVCAHAGALLPAPRASPKAARPAPAARERPARGAAAPARPAARPERAPRFAAPAAAAARAAAAPAAARAPAARRCRNTLGASPTAVVDSAGGVCAPGDLDGGGCCCGASPPPCAACAGGGCCATYEACVACCVSDAAAPARDRVRRGATHAVLRGAASDFELCRFRCLTNSGSVLHQNSYRAADRFCFDATRAPLADGMSVNSDAETRAALLAGPHGEAADPYVAPLGRAAGAVFPCGTDACAAPEQDVAKLREAARGAT